jgi:hypothetical protein
MPEPMNVREPVTLIDTVLCSKYVAQMSDRPQGWFDSFAAMGTAGEFSFFNVRNKSIGIMWNNQDSRDQMPYGLIIDSIGVSFVAPGCASQFTACDRISADPAQWDPSADEPDPPAEEDLVNREELHSAVWSSDLPNHASVTLTTNQDERLVGFPAMFPPGYGPVGGGWGWGSPNDFNVDPVDSDIEHNILCGSFAGNLQTIQEGTPDIRQRCDFPVSMEVPKRATLRINVRLSVYGREMLKAMIGPHWFTWVDDITGVYPDVMAVSKAVKATAFGIQCTIKGTRLVQQRGDYHV